MKKTTTLLLFICSGLFAIHGQVTLTFESHGLQAGETHASQKVQFKDPGSAGQGLVWDFSDITPTADAETSLVESVSGDGYNRVASRGSDKIDFLYNNTDLSNEYRGYRSGDFIVSYDRPVVKTAYPQSFGSYFEGTFEGTMSHQGKNMGSVGGAYSTSADATGTLLLPGNLSLPVLRVKTTERITEWACSNQIVEIEKYLWYAQDTRYPVFVSIITTTRLLSDNSERTTKLSYLNLNIEQPQWRNASVASSEIAYRVSPNPFRDNITISYELPREMKVGVDLYSVQGVKLATIVPAETQKGGSQSVTINILPYTQTEKVYFVKMQFGDKAYSEKIVKEN